MLKHDHDPNDRSWIGAWVKKQREAHGLSVTDLAAAVRCSAPRISQIEANDYPPGLELLWRLTAFFAEDEERLAMSEAQVRNILECLVVSINPRRLHYLWELPHLEAREVIDAHGTRRALRREPRPVTKES